LGEKEAAMKLFLKIMKRVVFPIFLLISIALLFYNTNPIGRLMYPIQYQQEIQISAESYQVDPLLIAAIIRVESNYKPDLESAKKAAGLMQIMPDTADWIISRAGYSSQMKLHMKEPDVNIEMGTWYLHWLWNRFDDQFEQDEDLVAVIAASYNAGHNKVGEWIREDIWDGRYETRDQIPFGETRHYVKRVMYYYNKYTSFYADVKLGK